MSPALILCISIILACIALLLFSLTMDRSTKRCIVRIASSIVGLIVCVCVLRNKMEQSASKPLVSKMNVHTQVDAKLRFAKLLKRATALLPWKKRKYAIENDDAM